MNNTLEEIHSRIPEAEARENNLEDKMLEITATEQNIEKKRNEDRLRDLWDNIKCINICIIGVPEGKEREKGPEKIFEEIIAENFCNMRKVIINLAQSVPGRINQEGTYQVAQ